VSGLKWSLPCNKKWGSDMCQVNGSRVAKLGSIYIKMNARGVVFEGWEIDHIWIPNGGDYILNL
jgi:hypothetical protein